MHIVFQNPEIIFYYIFCIFNLDFFRALILQKCIGSMYLVRATPPTFSGRPFWNFTQAFRPRRGGSNEYPQSMFWAEMWKNIRVLSEIFQFLEVRFSIYIWIGMFS